MNQTNIDELAKEAELKIRGIVHDIVQGIKHPSVACTELIATFKAGFLAASPKSKEEDIIDFLKKENERITSLNEELIKRLRDTSGMQEMESIFEKEAELRYPVKTHVNPPDSPYVNSQITFLHGCRFGLESAPLLSTQQGEDEEDLFLQLVADIRLYENNSQEYEDFILQLKSKYKISTTG